MFLLFIQWKKAEKKRKLVTKGATVKEHGSMYFLFLGFFLFLFGSSIFFEDDTPKPRYSYYW